MSAILFRYGENLTPLFLVAYHNYITYSCKQMSYLYKNAAHMPYMKYNNWDYVLGADNQLTQLCKYQLYVKDIFKLLVAMHCFKIMHVKQCLFLLVLIHLTLPLYLHPRRWISFPILHKFYKRAAFLHTCGRNKMKFQQTRV